MAKMLDRATGLGAPAVPGVRGAAGALGIAPAHQQRTYRPGLGGGRSDDLRYSAQAALRPGGRCASRPGADLAYPGEFPYTRGIHPRHVSRPPLDDAPVRRLRQRQQTNERYHFLLEQGQNGLSVAFDMPTLMGYDSDAPQARGEVGKCGVAIDSLARYARRSSTGSTWARSPPR